MIIFSSSSSSSLSIGPIDDVSKIKVIELDTILENTELLKYERILLKKSL
jgi:hypothetical protein